LFYSFARSGDHAKEIGTNLCFTCPVVSTCWAFFIPMKILQELESLIPPLSNEEFKQLERNILEEGIREPLITWNGILIDGHNRYRIAQEHDMNYETLEKEFENINRVKEWMIHNQFGRRNLSNYQRSVLALQLEDVFREKAKEKELERKTTFLKSEKSNLETINSIKEISKIANVGHDTIAKVKKIEANATPEVKARLNTGTMSINEAYKEIKKEEKQNNFETNKANFEKEIISTKEYLPKYFIGNSIDVLKKEPLNKISLLLSDPPYGMDFKSGFDYDKKWDKIDNDKIEDTIPILDSVFYEAKKHLLPDAHIYIFGNPFEIENIKPVFEKYFKLKNILIWDREVIGMGDLKTYGRSYDIILFGYNEKWKDLNGTRDRDILRFNRVAPNNLKHPTEKPLDILEYLIKKSSNEGEYILDPFAGSFTTCEAAMNLNRNSYGIELQNKYLPEWMIQN
jgi:DNA modification methylase